MQKEAVNERVCVSKGGKLRKEGTVKRFMKNGGTYGIAEGAEGGMTIFLTS